MSQLYIKEKVYTKISGSLHPLEAGEYELCKFTNCDFSNTDFSGYIFSDCEFVGCNLSLVKLQKTALREVKFTDSKLSGLHFENCNQFGLSFTFEHCIINNASFFNIGIARTVFKNCEIHESDFSESDMSGVLFDYCDLLGSTFNHTKLEKADLRTAYNFSIDPDINRIKKAKFSLSGVVGLLGKYDIEIDGI